MTNRSARSLRRQGRVSLSAATAALVLLAVAPPAAADTTIEAETMRLRPGKARVSASASGGRIARVPGRGSAIKSVTSGRLSGLVISARARSCLRGGPPRMVVSVDGRRIATIEVGSDTWRAYRVDRPLPPGVHRLRLSVVRDRPTRKCDRTLLLDKVTLLSLKRGDPPAAHPPVLGPQPEAQFVGDFETGNHAQWTGIQAEASDRVQVVQAPVRQGRFASRFEVRSGDSTFGGARAEVQWGTHTQLTLRSGAEHYFGWSTYLAPGFPSPRPGEGHSLFFQTHPKGSTSPEIEMSTRDERIALKTTRGDAWSTPLQRAVWHDFVLRVRFSSSSSTGLLELWHNGVKVVTDFRAATLSPGSDAYLKLGYYRAGGIGPTGVVYHDGLRVATSLEAAVTR